MRTQQFSSASQSDDFDERWLLAQDLTNDMRWDAALFQRLDNLAGRLSQAAGYGPIQ